jgi:hypothetical protein
VKSRVPARYLRITSLPFIRLVANVFPFPLLEACRPGANRPRNDSTARRFWQTRCDCRPGRNELCCGGGRHAKAARSPDNCRCLKLPRNANGLTILILSFVGRPHQPGRALTAHTCQKTSCVPIIAHLAPKGKSRYRARRTEDLGGASSICHQAANRVSWADCLR